MRIAAAAFLFAIGAADAVDGQALPGRTQSGAAASNAENAASTAPRHGEYPLLSGTVAAGAGTTVEVTVGTTTHTAVTNSAGEWVLRWPERLESGTYEVTVRLRGSAEIVDMQSVRVEAPGRLPRRPIVDEDEEARQRIDRSPNTEDSQEYTDRWRITPPAYEILVRPRSKWDSYNQNILKGDFPIRGDDIFLNLTGISDSLAEARDVPTPSGASAENPGSEDFFGEGDQNFFNQNVSVSADLYKGRTAYRPHDWRVRVNVVANFNALDVRETGAVSPDVRRGSDREDGQLSLQDIFYERKLADLSPNFDFVSIRAGVQQFQSDFRGFIFSDTNLGVRLFGNYDNNRYQYNIALFERLEKDTNSGLNLIHELRDQRVFIANLYRQDFLTLGYTAQVSLHHMIDEPSLKYDTNGFLVRPDPVGAATPHEITATYVGWAGFGKYNRINLDHAAYYAFGRDELNPIAGVRFTPGNVRESVDISAYMGALELSYDRDWFRPKLAYFYASGDDDPTDRDAEGFASIFDNVAFAGGGFSLWNRLGIRLPATGVGLVQRGSLLPQLQSSKEEGQPNFVNPGLHLASAGLDVEVTQKAKAIFTLNYLRFDATDTLELLLFQDAIDKEIGFDLSAGLRYRPYLNNNVVVLGGAAVFLPGNGFEDIYEDDDPLYQLFTNLILTF